MLPTALRTGSGRPRPWPTVLAVVRAGAFAAACALSFACHRGDEASRIRDLVAEGSARAEKRDLEGLISLTTEGFRAEPGQRSREEAREVIAAAFYRYRRFRVLHPEPSVALTEDGGSARAALPFLIVREERAYPDLEELYRDPKGWLERVGENADLYQLSLDLVKTAEGWRVDGARLNAYRGPTSLR